MINILAAANIEYQSFFTGDWLIIGIAFGVIWAAKDSFSFGRDHQDDDEHLHY